MARANPTIRFDKKYKGAPDAPIQEDYPTELALGGGAASVGSAALKGAAAVKGLAGIPKLVRDVAGLVGGGIAADKVLKREKRFGTRKP